MCKLDDEEQTGYVKYNSILDALEMLDIDLTPAESQFLLLKIFDPKVKSVQNLHYPTLIKWLNQMESQFETKSKPILNENEYLYL
jgi:hypothetical protein